MAGRISTALGSQGALALGAVLAFAGCAHDGAQDAAGIPPPAMPTVGPSSNPPVPRSPESEIITAASIRANAGDIAGAQQKLALIDEPSERAHAGVVLIQTLAAQNPSKAATVAFALPPGPGQTAALETAAKAWVQRDSEAALRWSMKLTGPSASTARRAVADALVQANPREALDLLETLPPNPSRDEMLGHAAAAWARREPEDAVQWLENLPAGALRQHLTSSVAFEIALTSPERALALAESLPAGRDRWLVFSAIAQTWIAKDPKAAAGWAAQLPAGDAREAALSGIETGLGATARMALTAPGNARVNSRPVGSDVGIGVWPEGNSSAFAAWLATQPRPLSREEAVLEFVRQRAATDPGGVGAWVATLPPGPGRQQALEIYFAQAVRASPADTADWLRSLPGPDRSNEMIEKTAREWLQTDPRAAEAWLRTTTLPLVRQEELLREARR